MKYVIFKILKNIKNLLVIKFKFKKSDEIVRINETKSKLTD